MRKGKISVLLRVYCRKIISVQGIPKSEKERNEKKEYTRYFIRDDDFYSNIRSWCWSVFHIEYLCRCVCSLGFSLACVCSLNNKYHKYLKPRKMAIKADSIEQPSHERSDETRFCMNSSFGSRFVASNDLVFSIWWNEYIDTNCWLNGCGCELYNFFFLFSSTKSAFYIFLRGEKYVTYKKCFIKSNRLNVYIKVEQPTSGRERYSFLLK